jgi:hypothetical protein
LRVVEVALLLPRGDIQAIEHLTGPRHYVEEAMRRWSDRPSQH